MVESTTTKPDTGVIHQFKLVIEPDDDAWHAYCPTLRKYGAITWGETREEALRHISDVVGLVVRELVEDGEPVPVETEPIEEPSVVVVL